MKCDPRAHAQCPDRHICRSIHEAFFMDGSECDAFNQRILNQPMTYGDQIRTMSDEELAAFIQDVANLGTEYNSFCQNKKECQDRLDSDELIPNEWCIRCLVEKLRKPVEEQPKLPSGFFLDKEESGLTEEG